MFAHHQCHVESHSKVVITASDTMIYGCAGFQMFHQWHDGAPCIRARKTKRLELPELSRSHCTLDTTSSSTLLPLRKSHRTCAPRQRRRKLKGSEIASIFSPGISPLKARYQLITHTSRSHSPADTARLSGISASPLGDRYCRKGGQIYYTSPHLSALDTARRGRDHICRKSTFLREVSWPAVGKVRPNPSQYRTQQAS